MTPRCDYCEEALHPGLQGRWVGQDDHHTDCPGHVAGHAWQGRHDMTDDGLSPEDARLVDEAVARMREGAERAGRLATGWRQQAERAEAEAERVRQRATDAEATLSQVRAAVERHYYSPAKVIRDIREALGLDLVDDDEDTEP